MIAAQLLKSDSEWPIINDGHEVRGSAVAFLLRSNCLHGRRRAAVNGKLDAMSSAELDHYALELTLKEDYLLKLLNSIDGMDRQKLERLRKAVSDGTYSVRAEDLAQKLVDYMGLDPQQVPIQSSTPQLEPETRNAQEIVLPSIARSSRS